MVNAELVLGTIQTRQDLGSTNIRAREAFYSLHPRIVVPGYRLTSQCNTCLKSFEAVKLVCLALDPLALSHFCVSQSFLFASLASEKNAVRML